MMESLRRFASPIATFGSGFLTSPPSEAAEPQAPGVAELGIPSPRLFTG